MMRKFVVYIFIVISLQMCHSFNQHCSNEDQTSRFCETLCEHGKCEVKAAVILPKDPMLSVSSMSTVIPLLKLAVRDARKRGLLPDWIDIKLIEWDDKCQASNANIAIINTIINNKCIHVIFGPSCDYSLATVGRTIKFLDIPLLTAGGFTFEFDKPKINCNDEFYMMVRTGILYFSGLSNFVKSIFLKYGWHKILVLYEKNGQSEVAGSSTCSFMMQTLVNEMMDIPKFQYSDGDLGLTSLNLTDYLRREVGTQRAIIAMCADRKKIHEILLAAEELGEMVYNGEYIFINIELYNKGWSAEQPWIEPHYNNDTSLRLKNAYKSVITITTEYESNDTGEIKTASNYVNGFYDAMILFTTTLKNHFGVWSDKHVISNVTINSKDLLFNMLNTTYEGFNGDMIEIDPNGDRITYYSLLSLNKDKDKFEIVANYRRGDKTFRFIKGRKIHWPSGLQLAPSDTPKCGYDNSGCSDTSFPSYAIVSIVLVNVTITSVILFCIHRRSKFEAEIAAKSWKICWDDIKQYPEHFKANRDSVGSVFNVYLGSNQTLLSDITLVGERPLPIGYYKDQKVIIKKLAPMKTELSR